MAVNEHETEARALLDAVLPEHVEDPDVVAQLVELLAGAPLDESALTAIDAALAGHSATRVSCVRPFEALWLGARRASAPHGNDVAADREALVAGLASGLAEGRFDLAAATAIARRFAVVVGAALSRERTTQRTLDETVRLRRWST